MLSINFIIGTILLFAIMVTSLALILQLDTVNRALRRVRGIALLAFALPILVAALRTAWHTAALKISSTDSDIGSLLLVILIVIAIVLGTIAVVRYVDRRRRLQRWLRPMPTSVKRRVEREV